MAVEYPRRGANETWIHRQRPDWSKHTLLDGREFVVTSLAASEIPDKQAVFASRPLTAHELGAVADEHAQEDAYHSDYNRIIDEETLEHNGIEIIIPLEASEPTMYAAHIAAAAAAFALRAA